ncbi:MAG TPA: hypothetical protein VI583_17035 [Cyclobacteriaceae bacterium]|nr:hypothetical protein [Cyclobacteriaceae bacterium]
MAVFVKEVLNKKLLREFIYLPARLHKGHSTWIPPIYTDEWSFYDPRKNKAFSYCNTILGLAYDRGKTTGRIMGIINQRYNAIHNENFARFEFLDCINDQETGHALVSFIYEWARRQGMSKLVGPLGFSDKEPQGFLISGFEHRAILDSPCNHPYMIDIIEREGFIKFRDLGNYLIEIPGRMPELFERIYHSVMAKNNLYIKEFRKKKELKPYIIPVLRLMNETYMPIYGFLPLEEDEMLELARRYISVLDPDFIKLVMHENSVVGFAISIPDISEGLKRSGGYLFPVGLFYILRSLKKSDKLVVFLGAIKHGYRGKGIDAVLGVKTFETAIRREMKYIESHLILETNVKMIGEVEKAGGKPYKKFRIYQKDIG